MEQEWTQHLKQRVGRQVANINQISLKRRRWGNTQPKSISGAIGDWQFSNSFLLTDKHSLDHRVPQKYSKSVTAITRYKCKESFWASVEANGAIQKTALEPRNVWAPTLTLHTAFLSNTWLFFNFFMSKEDKRCSQEHLWVELCKNWVVISKFNYYSWPKVLKLNKTYTHTAHHHQEVKVYTQTKQFSSGWHKKIHVPSVRSIL